MIAAAVRALSSVIMCGPSSPRKYEPAIFSIDSQILRGILLPFLPIIMHPKETITEYADRPPSVNVSGTPHLEGELDFVKKYFSFGNANDLLKN